MCNSCTEAKKDDDMNDGLQTDDHDVDDGSEKEMGVVNEDGEADSFRLHKLVA